MNAKVIKTKEKKWILKGSTDLSSRTAKEKIAKDLGINPIIADLLYTRGYTTPETAKNFLYMENEMLCNPFDMKDMDKAVERVERAIATHERITIYGDYDVDGVTSVCTLYLYLKSKGADVGYYIPNRAGEGAGYAGGITSAAIDGIYTAISIMKKYKPNNNG